MDNDCIERLWVTAMGTEEPVAFVKFRASP